MRAMLLLVLAVPAGGAAAADHHVAVGLFAHPRHGAGHLLEALAVGGANLGQEVDVAAQFYAAVQVARKNGELLVLGHRPLVQVAAFVGLELLAVLGLHQRHAELVEPVALAALLGVEDGGAGNAGIGFVERHVRLLCLLPASRGGWGCPPAASSAIRAWWRCAE